MGLDINLHIFSLEDKRNKEEHILQHIHIPSWAGHHFGEEVQDNHHNHLYIPGILYCLTRAWDGMYIL